MTGVAEMFAEYSGQDLDWFQLAFYFETLREAQLESRRRSGRVWKKFHREAHRKHSLAWAKSNPTAKHAIDQRYRARNPDKVREWARNNSKAYRMRRASDPVWVAEQRRKARERHAARKRAERMLHVERKECG